MKLNNCSYVHVQIRKRCQLLECLTGMKLITNLNKQFDQIKFSSLLSYLIIDYTDQKCYTLCHKITSAELEIIESIMEDMGWLEIGENYQSYISS